MTRLLGRERAWRVFRSWHTARQPLQSSWRTMRAALLAADAIATTSRWENDYLARYFYLPAQVRSQMGLSRFGVDTSLYGRRFSEDELAAFRARYGLAPSYVVEVARIESKKGQLALIEALWRDPIDLVFVGSESPHFEPDYAARCREAGPQRGRVHFLGWLPKAELPLVYAAAGAHVLPSWFELPGLVSLEAGASGTRIVSTQLSPLSEMLGDRATYCDPYDPESIRSAVLSALERPVPPGLREMLLAQFGWDKAARVNLTLYESILQAR
jgi:glycosyltransferase involved in cell wall biosynthesis